MLTAITGINWGDEGKGRMVDLISQEYDIVARYWLRRNDNFSTFNATEIQNVIQQREKMIRTFLNFLQAIMNI